MCRRSGQNGYIEKKGKFYCVRFRMDVPGQSDRAYMSVRICPVEGLGAMNKFERTRRAREIIAESGADKPELLNKVQAVNLGVTFRQQADWWLRHMQKRKRKACQTRNRERLGESVEEVAESEPRRNARG